MHETFLQCDQCLKISVILSFVRIMFSGAKFKMKVEFQGEGLPRDIQEKFTREFADVLVGGVLLERLNGYSVYWRPRLLVGIKC